MNRMEEKDLATISNNTKMYGTRLDTIWVPPFLARKVDHEGSSFRPSPLHYRSHLLSRLVYLSSCRPKARQHMLVNAKERYNLF